MAPVLKGRKKYGRGWLHVLKDYPMSITGMLSIL